MGDGFGVFSMLDVRLGFGIATKSTKDSRKLDHNEIVVLHQAHIGEYLRMDFDGKIYYEWEFWILGVFNQVILVIYTCLCKKLSINMRFRF